MPALVVGRRNEICELDDAAEWDLGVAHVGPKRMRECPVQLEHRADHAESLCARPPLVVQLFGEQTRQRGELPREQNGFRGNELSSDRNAGHSLGFGHDLVDAGSGAHFGAALDELLLDRLEHLLEPAAKIAEHLLPPLAAERALLHARPHPCSRHLPGRRSELRL